MQYLSVCVHTDTAGSAYSTQCVYTQSVSLLIVCQDTLCIHRHTGRQDIEKCGKVCPPMEATQLLFWFQFEGSCGGEDTTRNFTRNMTDLGGGHNLTD